jgi:hypothetical protein
MARLHRALALSFAAALLAGCDDRESTPVAPAARFSQQAVEHVDDRAVADRFTLDVDVNGSLRPGQPIHLTLRGRANFRTGDADVRLTLPEVSAAEQSGWDVVELPIGEESRPQIRVRRAFSAGEELRERTSITIPEPGYYYVVATAKQRSDDRLTDRPNQVTDVSTHTMWLWIDEHGGRVTAEFDSTLFSGDARKERGPGASRYKPPRVRRKDDVYVACTVSPWPAPEVTIQACPSDGGTVTAPSEGGAATHALRVTYDNTDAGHTYTPVANAHVEWRVTTAGGGFVSSGTAMTDASGGMPLLQCQGTTSERNVSVSVYTRNERVSVTYGRGALAGTYTAPCGGTGEVRLDPLMAHLFINLLKTAEGHRVQFGQLPNRIYAGMYDDGKTYYDFDHPDGEMHIYHVGRMVWGDYGAFVAAHEYGHYFQDRVLYFYPAPNGLMRFYRGCRDPHVPESTSNFGCALGEGFADWYGVLVRGSATGRWVSDIESGFYYTHCVPGYTEPRGMITCSDDGSVVEGAVASLLWDMSDGIGTESHDGLQIHPANIVAAIKNCGVHPASRASQDRIPFTGIDHLIYCWENRQPYEVDMMGSGVRIFFNTRPRSDWPDRVLGSAIANGDDRFRRMWLVNLYRKRPEVGTVPIFREQSPVDAPYIEPETEPLPPPEPEPCYSDGFRLICPTV